MKLTTIVWRSLIAAALTGAVGCSTGPDAAHVQPAPFSQSNDEAANQQTSVAPGDPSSLVPTATIVAAGTSIAVRLQDAVSSATANTGDRFKAVLAEPLVASDGQSLAPRGAAVTGQVVAARHSGRLHGSGYVRIALTSVEMKGKVVPIRSTTLFTAGQTANKRNVEMIGGGALARPLPEALVPTGPRPLQRIAVTTASGTDAPIPAGKKKVGFGPERTLVFRLKQPVRLG